MADVDSGRSSPPSGRLVQGGEGRGHRSIHDKEREACEMIFCAATFFDGGGGWEHELGINYVSGRWGGGRLVNGTGGGH